MAEATEPQAETRHARTHRTQKKRREPKKQTFLKALARIPAVTYACKAARIGRSAVYDWREKDPVFAAKWDEAISQGLPTLEDEALRRAMTSSDTLMIFLLKSLNRQKYGDKVDLLVQIRSDPQVRALVVGVAQVLQDFVPKEMLQSAINRLRAITSIADGNSGSIGPEHHQITDARTPEAGEGAAV